MSKIAPQLPSSWARVPLSAIATVNPRGTGVELPDEAIVSFLPMKAVAEESGEIDLSQSRPLGEVRKGYTQFADGDILLAKITPCMENGKAAVVSGLRHGIGFGSTEFHVVRLLSAEFSRRFFFHYLVQRGFRREARRHMTGSAGQLRVPSAYLAEVAVPIPPLPEQRRIVAKIEELFTRLDAGVAALQAAKQQIKRYRQAVLRDAFTGELTREWREGGGNADGDAECVLEEIGKRRRGWLQAETSRGNSEAKRLASKLRRETRYTPAHESLPQGWRWGSLMSVAQVVVDCHNKTAPYEDTGVPLIRTTNIRDGRISLSGAMYVSQKTYEFWSRRCPPAPGDIIFTREAPMGECGIVPPDTTLCMGQRMVLIRVFPDLLPPAYVCYAIRAPRFQRELGNAGIGTGVKHLRVGDVETLVLPVAPLAEQKRIVAEIDRHFSLADAAEKAVDESLAKAARLRQSILKQAFEGRLVPQDPNDEPAEKLLERIRERSKVQAGTASPLC